MEELSEKDIKQIENHGISLDVIEKQIKDLSEGFPYLNILSASSTDNGIMSIDAKEQSFYMQEWDNYLSDKSGFVTKMVPASGAASRMFKELFEFMHSDEDIPINEKVMKFFENLKNFAFYDLLNEVTLRSCWKTIPKLIETKEYKSIIKYLLTDEGLNYGNKPKGLILFHRYDKRTITSVEEHLSEGALYAKNRDGNVNIHFTVSPEHRKSFMGLIDKVKNIYESKWSVIYNISFSEQKHSTDTIALDDNGKIFRNPDGSILFRPSGHGALIENLNDIDSDIVFIKNIDNVVPDRMKGDTIIYKKTIAGILVNIQKHIHKFLNDIDNGKEDLNKIIDFMSENLCIKKPEFESVEELKLWVISKLNRPIRVCGMVRNDGEPGGGPFVIQEPDGSTSLQILESSQINSNDMTQVEMLQKGGYFNPVDIVCALKDYKGNKFDLKKFVNQQTGFISSKSSNGMSLRALEVPGLWNGAMHNWNTIFIEVPSSTFNPVKTVFDLLRSEHQSK